MHQQISSVWKIYFVLISLCREHPNFTLGNLRGSLVALKCYTIQPNKSYTSMRVLIDEFKWVGSGGSYPFGDTDNIKFLPEYTELLKKLRYNLLTKILFCSENAEKKQDGDLETQGTFLFISVSFG